MAQEYTVNVSAKAEDELTILVDYVANVYGKGYAISLDDSLSENIYSLNINPTRHMRVRYLLGRQFEYRRVLVGKKHRIIFTINEVENIVEVLRIDLQSSDPQMLDDLR